MELKRCSKCGEEKATAEFYHERRRVGALQAWCKECFRDRRLADPDRYRGYSTGSLARLKNKIMDRIGGMVCACCGSVHGLCIDHTFGNGAEERARFVDDNGHYRMSRHRRWMLNDITAHPEHAVHYRVLCTHCNASAGKSGSPGNPGKCKIDHTTNAQDVASYQHFQYIAADTFDYVTHNPEGVPVCLMQS